MITTVVFDYGGVISSPLFVGIGEFEAAEGYPKGSLLRLLFGEVDYVGVEGRAVAAEVLSERREVGTPLSSEWGPSGPEPEATSAGMRDAVVSDPDAVEASGEVTDEPDWHLLEKGLIDFATYFERISEKAPAVLGKPIDLEAYGRFMRSSAPGVHWMVVHKIRELQARGLRLALLTNNIKEFGEHWRATFPIDELFEEIVDSSHVGMRKPDAEIYALLCTRMGIEARDAVFVDDNRQNVAAARAFGMEGVHFGDNPWHALAELDGVLERRGTASRV